MERLAPPLPADPASTLPAGPRQARPPDPFQTCDGCERVFRAAQPGLCRDCRSSSGAVGRRLPRVRFICGS
ncbi:hypothetical protein STRIP9103_04666 [Streptomyces ipomoeae 91-03]|uniref:Uncharacterized protein n=1 Tax=Streptomyces ipomoeae 91-03 TaxID=698759 RepID=L1KWN2_9ACTN|nr:hypothetical protein STRIP9103_04666 [Streptomyces ipomoeae 91-03]